MKKETEAQHEVKILKESDILLEINGAMTETQRQKCWENVSLSLYFHLECNANIFAMLWCIGFLCSQTEGHFDATKTHKVSIYRAVNILTEGYLYENDILPGQQIK